MKLSVRQIIALKPSEAEAHRQRAIAGNRDAQRNYTLWASWLRFKADSNTQHPERVRAFKAFADLIGDVNWNITKVTNGQPKP